MPTIWGAWGIVQDQVDDVRLIGQRTIQEGNDLSTVADEVNAKGSFAHTVGDPVRNGPCNGGGVVLTGLHVGEGHIGRGSGSALCTPQEGDHLGAVALEHGAKVVGIHTVGDAFLDGPQDGFVVEVLLIDIREGICSGGRLGRTGIPTPGA